MTATAEPLLHLRDVSRTYAEATPVHALVGVDLRVERGELMAVVGPSGSGKSTMLNLLGLLDRPTTGSYVLDGVETTELSEKGRTALRSRRIGFIFQAFHLLPGRSSEENVELGMLYQGLPRATRRERARDVLDRVGLAHRRDADPATLSGGERQRVAIARALACGPDVLLCDEPTGNLDHDTSEAVLGLLVELNRDGLTVLVVTHDRSIAARTPRQVSVSDGRVSG